MLFFYDETNVRMSSDGIVRVFWRNRTRFREKNTKILFALTITYVLGTMQSDGRKLLVRCPNKPKGCWLFGNFEKITKKNRISWTLFFNKIMLLCLNRRLSAILSKKTSRRNWNGQLAVPIWIRLKICARFWSNCYENRQFFGKI